MHILMLSWESDLHAFSGLGRHVSELSLALGPCGLHVCPIVGSRERLWDETASGRALASRVPAVEVAEGWSEGGDSPRASTYGPPSTLALRTIDEANFAAIATGLRAMDEAKGPWVVHAHDWHLGRAAMALAWRGQCPLVSTFHTLHGGGPQADGEAVLARASSAVVGVSESVADALRPLNPEVRVICGGVRLESMSAEAGGPPLPSGWLPGDPVVLYVGRLAPEKGVHVLLQAVSALRGMGVEANCMVIGDGASRASLESGVERAGLSGKVSFLGAAPDELRNQWMARAAVLAIPSIYEPFGLVGLEAMVARLPVVASDTGGLVEFVRHMKTGLTHRPGDPISLAFAIRRLLDDAVLAERLAQQAYGMVSSHYTWPQAARANTELYASLLLG